MSFTDWDTFLLKFLCAIVVTFVLIIVWFRRRYSHWKKLGLAYIEPSIPFGNAGDNFWQKIHEADWYANFYRQMRGRKLKHAGSYFFYKPVYVPLDLDLIKRIMQTDFQHFTDRGEPMNEKDDPLSAHLFSLAGQKWRNLRVKLTPTFTSGKMKTMFPIIAKISEELVKTLKQECEFGEPIDLKDISARFTTDVIGNCAFGIDCNSLKDPDTEFRVQGRRISNLTQTELIVSFLASLFPSLTKFLGARIVPKTVADFFWNVIKETVEYRTRKGVRRSDALQLLMDLMNKEGKESESSLTFSELAAQAFVFFVAGFETSSTLMSFALVELAANQTIQDKVREEINTALKGNGDELSYDALHDMRYLDMVISESLRKYPPLPTLTRECTKDYRVPESDIVLRKGDTVFIPVKAIHYDPEYYPNPEEFVPNRFSEENRRKLHQFAFLPFGEGPRICIGLRFGLMQAKVGLAMLIRDFQFKLNPHTEMPIKLDPANFMTAAEGPLLADVEKIN